MNRLSGYIPKKVLKKEPDFTDSVFKMSDTIDGADSAVKSKLNKLDNLIKKADQVIEDQKVAVTDHIGKVLDTKVQEINDALDTTVAHIKSITKGDSGVPGRDGTTPDKSEIIREVLGKVPRIDEAGLEQRILSKVPKGRSNLKIVQEKAEIDPMAIIDQILALPEDKLSKLKLKSSNIDGLDQTISAFKNQIGSARGYVHGGGISNITGLIQQGTNVTISGAGTKDSPYVINASGGASGVTSVTATLPISSSGGTTPNISMTQSSAIANGWLSSTDWSTFNSKQSAGTYVTSLTVATANGFSGSFTAGATPVLTIIAGAITPSSVNSVVISGSSTPTLSVTGSSSISGTNTGDQTNITGNAATVTTNANLTGPITSTGNATAIASQTGTGTKFVMDTSPTLITPTIGAATGTSLTLSTPGTSSTDVPNLTSTNTLTNKRVTRRFVTVTQSATPSTNTDNMDIASITGLAQAITSMTTNLTGTPVAGDMLMYQITDNGTARGITWGAKFASTTNYTLPTTTVISTLLRVLFQWNTVTAVWECVGVD